MRIHFKKDIWKTAPEATDNTEKVVYIEGACDSSETKPNDGVADGSILVESDTGDVYFYNENSEAWVKQFTFKE